MDDAPLDGGPGRIDRRRRRRPAARPRPLRPRPGDAGRAEDPDHPRLLREAAAALPAGGRVSPGFTVLEDEAARRVSAEARERRRHRGAGRARRQAERQAYAYFSVALDSPPFEAMFADFERRRVAIAAYVAGLRPPADCEADVWRRCGFDAPADVGAIRRPRPGARPLQARWKRGAACGSAPAAAAADQALGHGAAAPSPPNRDFEALWAVLLHQERDAARAAWAPRRRLAPDLRGWLDDEQRLVWSRPASELKAARSPRTPSRALTLAMAYVELYEGEKARARRPGFRRPDRAAPRRC